MKAALIDILKRTAEQLSPLTQSDEGGWEAIQGLDGKPLRPHQHWRDVALRVPSRRAIEWRTRLSAVADLLEAQDGSLSERQVAYLRKLLCGGTQSFSDLSFDSSDVGDIAAVINRAMMERREEFTALFRQPA
jgi:hypothetical protein